MAPAAEHDLPFLPLSYDYENSKESALNLVYAVEPKWKDHEDAVEMTKFTDGITNSVSGLHLNHALALTMCSFSRSLRKNLGRQRRSLMKDQC